MQAKQQQQQQKQDEDHFCVHFLTHTHKHVYNSIQSSNFAAAAAAVTPASSLINVSFFNFFSNSSLKCNILQKCRSTLCVWLTNWLMTFLADDPTTDAKRKKEKWKQTKKCYSIKKQMRMSSLVDHCIFCLDFGRLSLKVTSTGTLENRRWLRTLQFHSIMWTFFFGPKFVFSSDEAEDADDDHHDHHHSVCDLEPDVTVFLLSKKVVTSFLFDNFVAINAFRKKVVRGCVSVCRTRPLN